MTNSIPANFNNLLKKLGKNLLNLIRVRHRALLVISGSNPERLGELLGRAVTYYERSLVRHLKTLENSQSNQTRSVLYVYHDEFPEAIKMKEVYRRIVNTLLRKLNTTYATYEISEKYLGTTFDVLIMDLTHDLKPNDLGRLIGIVRGGGLILLATPPWNSWDRFLSIFKRNLVVPQYPEPRHIFIEWVKRKLLEHNNIAIYDADEEVIVKSFEFSKVSAKSAKSSIEYPKETIFPLIVYEQAVTQDQVSVINILERFYEKPRKGEKKLAVIVADRGRGKSCAVGIGVVGLVHFLSKLKPKVRVLITAPEPSNIQSLMMLARQTLEKLGVSYSTEIRGSNVIELRGDKFSIEYWEPVAIPKLKGDIVVIDEAAGLSVTILYKIWEAHSRVVVSTTIHGYEGAGRGFSLRFLGRVRKDPRAVIYEYEMKEPIRYADDDPIEKWQFSTLLLDAEPCELDHDDQVAVESLKLEYVKYDPKYLFSPEGEDELKQLFGIYVLAHYRNEPDDLGMIADAPHHIIRAVKLPSGKVVCAIQAAIEGPIERREALELLKGGKIPGNIIPDRFLKHLRMVEFANTKGLRIVRIATHPSLQGRGIGTWALSKAIEEAKNIGLDWVGAGFGVNEDLLKFWLKLGFKVIHISPARNPVSGEYTVIVIKPISMIAEDLVNIASREFVLKLLNSISINYRDLEITVAKLMLEQGASLIKDFKQIFCTPIQVDRLWTYCNGSMTFEASADLMYLVARYYWLLEASFRPKLSRVQEEILIGKVLQGRAWSEVASELKVNERKIMEEARDIACKALKLLVNEPEKYFPGVSIASSIQSINRYVML
ncbi:MAG: tRNA(Met) cytidine acetyltransferase TmcA [Sulfolobales archaeon]|nr:tRNA(Met) cytidine acetyltransferase TmcA [Sulfolobales archaeon]